MRKSEVRKRTRSRKIEREREEKKKERTGTFYDVIQSTNP